MITIRIGAHERNLKDIDESWINKVINGYKNEGTSPCILVLIHEGSLNLTLATPGCSAGGGGGRPPNNDESRVFNLWSKFGLDTHDFSGGNFIAFIKQLQKLL